MTPVQRGTWCQQVSEKHCTAGGVSRPMLGTGPNQGERLRTFWRLTLLTTSPQVHSFAIGILAEDLRGEVPRGASKTCNREPVIHPARCQCPHTVGLGVLSPPKPSLGVLSPPGLMPLTQPEQDPVDNPLPYSPNQACWSPSTSMARPKSASLTAAPFSLEASSRFSGCRRRRVSQREPMGSAMTSKHSWGKDGCGPTALWGCVSQFTVEDHSLSAHPPLCCFAPELLKLSRSSHMAFLPTPEDARHRLTGFCITDGVPTPSHRPIPAAHTFRSRWTTPIWWQCRTASRICWMQWLQREEKSHTSALVTSTRLHLTPLPFSHHHIPPAALQNSAPLHHTSPDSGDPTVGHQGVSRELGLCTHPWAPTELAPGAGDRWCRHGASPSLVSKGE